MNNRTLSRHIDNRTLSQQIIERTLRVPRFGVTDGDNSTLARQLDVALMNVGFKLSGDALRHIGSMRPSAAEMTIGAVTDAVRHLVGAHVEHNVYFKEFPRNVPDTLDFWMEQATHVFLNADGSVTLAVDLNVNQVYGRYQHSYEDMLAAHEELIPSIKDRVTVLRLGDWLDEEMVALFRELAGSRIPLSESDRELLSMLAEACTEIDAEMPIPIRENRAIINRARIWANERPVIDTVTDILRLAAMLSDADVTLEKAPKFTSMPRTYRRIMLEALDGLIAASPGKMEDVVRYREYWKRLGERLHPHEYTDLPRAQEVFAAARREIEVRSFNSQIEQAFRTNDLDRTLTLLERAPGMLARNIDRLAVRFNETNELGRIAHALFTNADRVSGRVLLSLLENMQNRSAEAARLKSTRVRMFANMASKAQVIKDTRMPLPDGFVTDIAWTISREIVRRSPMYDTLVVDKDALGIALPLSAKMLAPGIGIVPRGSVTPITSSHVRFFVYWKQKEERTDYDLSLRLLDKDYQDLGQVSYTNLRYGDIVHSGDVVTAYDGAFEAMDVPLDKIDAASLVPSINIYNGESFMQVEECFFGYMAQDEQEGGPFEPRTVRAKSEMRGGGKVCLPFIMMKDDRGNWSVKWLHLFLRGRERYNVVERTLETSALLTRAIIERQYLTLDDLVSWLSQKTGELVWAQDGIPDKPVTYIGLSTPEGLHSDSKVITPLNLATLIPD